MAFPLPCSLLETHSPCSLLETLPRSPLFCCLLFNGHCYGQKTERNTPAMWSDNEANCMYSAMLFFIFICILYRINFTKLKDGWRWLFSVHPGCLCTVYLHTGFLSIHVGVTVIKHHRMEELLGSWSSPGRAGGYNSEKKLKKKKKGNIVCTYSKWQEWRKQSPFIISRQFGQDSFQNGDKL